MSKNASARRLQANCWSKLMMGLSYKTHAPVSSGAGCGGEEQGPLPAASLPAAQLDQTLERTSVHAEERQLVLRTPRGEQSKQQQGLQQQRLPAQWMCSHSPTVTLRFMRCTSTDSDIPPGPLTDQGHLMISYRHAWILQSHEISASDTIRHLHMTKSALRTLWGGTGGHRRKGTFQKASIYPA